MYYNEQTNCCNGQFGRLGGQMKLRNKWIICILCVMMSALFVSLPVKADNYKTLKRAAIDTRVKVENHQERLSVKFKSKSADYMKLIDKFFEYLYEDNNNHNQGDYMKWGVSSRKITYISRTKDANDKNYKYIMDFEMSYLMTKKQSDKVNSKAADVLSKFNFTSATTDYQKIKKIYDYVCSNVEYSSSSKNDIVYTSYSALVEKNAVCQGYALLIYKMCRMSGLKCRLISGTANNGKMTDTHGWNIVKIGKYYYNLDATWDSQRLQHNVGYAYFLKSDGFNNHYRDDALKTYKFYKKHPMAAADYGTNAGYSIKSQKAIFKYKKPKLAKSGKKYVKIKNVKDANSYEFKYSKYPTMRKAKTKLTKKNKVKINNRRYVKVRAIKIIGGKSVKSQWTTKKI